MEAIDWRSDMSPFEAHLPLNSLLVTYHSGGRAAFMAHFHTVPLHINLHERVNTARQCERDVGIFSLFHSAIVDGWAECTVNTN